VEEGGSPRDAGIVENLMTDPDRPYTPGTYDLRPRPVAPRQERANAWLERARRFAAQAGQLPEPRPVYTGPSRLREKLNARRREEMTS
jgi:hypothetical protein